MLIHRLSTFLQIACRNLVRHRWRTLVTAFITVLSLVAILGAVSVNNGIDRQMTFSVSGSVSGDIEVAPATGRGEAGLSLAAVSPERLGKLPGVAYAAGRVALSGMAAGRTSQSVVSIRGVDPRVEKRLTANLMPDSGASLADLGAGQAAVSSVLATQLGLAVGDALTLSVSRAAGGLTSRSLHVSTVFTPRSSPGWIENTVYLTAPEAATLAGLAPGWVSHVLVFIEDPAALAAVRDRVVADLSGVPDLKVISWKEGAYKVVLLANQFVAALTVVMGAILVLMIGVVLTTVVMMGVLERRHELGICAALGFKPPALLGLLLLEHLLLQLAATAVGLALSWLLVTWFSGAGIPAGNGQLVRMFAGPRLYPWLRLSNLLWPAMLVNALALIATVAAGLRTVAEEPVSLLGRS